MKSLDKPKINAKDTFRTCISIVRDSELRARLNACESLIISAEEEFNSRISSSSIHTVVEENVVNGNVTAKELENVYTQRMAKKDVPGRAVYDKLISAPYLGICPFCSHRLVETLDHYLPKAKFPRLVVTPINLIPSCYTCNKSKLISHPTKPEEAILHPYYDKIDMFEWLSAKVNRKSPPSISYFINPKLGCPSLLKTRLKNHFHSFALPKLYSIQAAVLIRGLSSRLESIHSRLGAIGVKEYLAEEAHSRSIVDKNSWQTAFYSAVSKDDWFCNGGFKMK